MSRYLEVTSGEKAFQMRTLLFERNSRRQMLEEITSVHDTDSYQYLTAYAELKVADTLYNAIKALDFGDSL